MGHALAITTRNTGARAATASPAAAYNYNYMYPYLNNQMRTDLNPGVTPEQGSNPINVITKTEQLSAPRRVVSRTSARSATTGTTSARAATSGTARATRHLPPRQAQREAAPPAIAQDALLPAPGQIARIYVRPVVTHPRQLMP